MPVLASSAGARLAALVSTFPGRPAGSARLPLPGVHRREQSGKEHDRKGGQLRTKKLPAQHCCPAGGQLSGMGCQLNYTGCQLSAPATARSAARRLTQ